ncbi:MAG: NAD(P)H-hydrate dehydratase [Candidatus Latescibacterota bacterium]
MIVLTAEQMARVDRETIERGTPGVELMRNAGEAVFRLMESYFEPLAERKTVVLAGKGNNGGDGFRVAELLAGAEVSCAVLLLGKRNEARGDALTCLRDAERAGCPIIEVTGEETLKEHAEEILTADVIVDAIFGTGLRDETTGLAAGAIELINQSPAEVVAVDIPSGVNASTGEVSEHTVRADLTVTFGCLKVGHVMKPGNGHCGEIRVEDIGFSREVMDATEPFGYALTLTAAAELLPERPWNAHKYSSGTVFLVASSVGMTGAAILAATAAMRTGAGMVRVGCPESLNDILAVRLTEALTAPLPEVSRKRCLSLRALGNIRQLAEKASVVALGPGLGKYFETVELVRRFVGGYRGKIVLDADGLNAFEGAVDQLVNTPAEIVLTPHAGELSRLTGRLAKEISADPVRAARDAARSLGHIVLLKGPTTVIAAPSGEVWLNGAGSQALATAGSGDVLTGIIAGLIAQGMDCFQAAVLGAFIHGLCGDLATLGFGSRGILSGDLPDIIPQAFHRIVTA